MLPLDVRGDQKDCKRGDRKRVSSTVLGEKETDSMLLHLNIPRGAGRQESSREGYTKRLANRQRTVTKRRKKWPGPCILGSANG